jgi:cytochrome c556
MRWRARGAAAVGDLPQGESAMRSTARWWAFLFVGVGVLTWSVVRSEAHTHDHAKLPPGPIRDRAELMKGIGDQAQNIHDAFNMGAEGFDTGVIQRDAQVIAESAHKIPSLFPPGSTDPNSRALPAIWDNWDKFVQLAKQLEDQADSLSRAAGSGNDEKLKEKTQKMMATCKSCHDQFRRPEHEKKKGQ